MLKGLFYVVGAILFVFIVFSLTEGLGLISTGFFAPKREAIRREVFENTKSFNEAKKQDLIRYRLQYLQAEGDEKKVIASTIRMMFADYDESKLESELRDFLVEIKY